MEPQKEVAKLPLAAVDELIMLATVAPSARSNLRAPFEEHLWAHDAEGEGGCAFGSTPVSAEMLEEMSPPSPASPSGAEPARNSAPARKRASARVRVAACPGRSRVDRASALAR